MKAIACQLPARLGLPFSRLEILDIRSEWKFTRADLLDRLAVRGSGPLQEAA